MISFPKKKYKLIYADPPWKFKDAQKPKNRGAAQHYKVLSGAELKSLPVQQISAKDCFLAMWYVSTQTQLALDVAAAWGFDVIKTDGFVWNKITRNGLCNFGMGHYTRPSCENVLFAKRGRVKIKDHSVRQLIEAPIREHSRKPEIVRERLERLLGRCARIELFARERVVGWDSFGDELGYFDGKRKTDID